MNAKNTSKLTDEQLVAQVKEGNKRSMGELYLRYHLLVFSKCLSFAKNTDDANDLTQDIMIRVMEKIVTFKGKSKFSTWLYAITFNHCTDSLRKSKGTRFLSLEDQYDLADDSQNRLLLALELDQKEKWAGRAMKTIASEDQELLLMKYEQKKSIQELQTLYDLSASAIKMRLLRARAKAVGVYNFISTQTAA